MASSELFGIFPLAGISLLLKGNVVLRHAVIWLTHPPNRLYKNIRIFEVSEIFKRY